MSLFRRSFLESIGARFSPGFIHEDELYSALVYFNASRVEGIDRFFYHRRVHPGSTMTTSFSKKNLAGYMNVLDNLPSIVSDIPGCLEAKKLLDRNLCLCLMHNGWVLERTDRLRIVSAILKRPWAFQFKPFSILLLKRYFR